jgi:hypothetical protein
MPVNNSPNNIGGAQNLPPAQPAMIWYPYATSTEFPELGAGGRTIAAGPVYHFDPTLDSAIKLREYYDNTLFIYEWSRRWIKEVKLDEQGNILKINPFAENIPLSRPIEMELGPDGALYVLEWGNGFGGDAEAQLVRIEFTGTPKIVSADFDDDGAVDGNDFLRWQQGLGIPGGAQRADGDADVDGDVDADDLGAWSSQFGGAAAATSSSSVAMASPSATLSAAEARAAAFDALYAAGDFTGLLGDADQIRPAGRRRLRGVMGR